MQHPRGYLPLHIRQQFIKEKYYIREIRSSCLGTTWEAHGKEGNTSIHPTIGIARRQGQDRGKTSTSFAPTLRQVFFHLLSTLLENRRRKKNVQIFVLPYTTKQRRAAAYVLPPTRQATEATIAISERVLPLDTTEGGKDEKINTPGAKSVHVKQLGSSQNAPPLPQAPHNSCEDQGLLEEQTHRSRARRRWLHRQRAAPSKLRPFSSPSL